MTQLLYEDDEIIIIDKPAGLASQPGERVGSSVISAVERDLGFKPYPVHRLDKETAGCMILARSPAIAARWSALVAGRAIRKTYLAICSAVPARPEGRYDDPLESSGRRLEAVTMYRCKGSFGARPDNGKPFSLVRYELGTGRTHQIRRHSALHGHPLLGDDRYGDFALNKLLRKTAGVKKLMLWACRLGLPGGLIVRSRLPDHFSEFLSKYDDAPDPEDC